MTTTEPIGVDNAGVDERAIEIIETVREGDTILFNDRVEPLTVDRVSGPYEGRRGFCYVVLEGPRGGIYQLVHHKNAGDETVRLRRRTGYDNGRPTYDNMRLDSIEIVNCHEFSIGQVYEVTDPNVGDRYLYVVTGFDSGCYDVETVGIWIEDGEVVRTKESGFFNDHAKAKIFNESYQLVHELDIGYRVVHYDTERGEEVRLSDPHDRGVDLRPTEGHDLEVVGWDTVLFGDRFQANAPADGDQPEIVADGGVAASPPDQSDDEHNVDECEECGCEYPSRPPVLEGGEEKDLCHDCYVDGFDTDDIEDTPDDYVDLGELFDRVVERPDNCDCDELLADVCPPCSDMGFDTPNHDGDPTDHWGQPVQVHDEPSACAGERCECRRCGSRKVEVVAGTDACAADSCEKWEEFYRCPNCEATGSFRVTPESHRWVGAIDYPKDGLVTDGGRQKSLDGGRQEYLDQYSTSDEIAGSADEDEQAPETWKVWRDYEKGKLGIQGADRPARLFDPAVARQKADKIERGFDGSSLDGYPGTDTLHDILDTIREYADELEQLDEVDG